MRKPRNKLKRLMLNALSLTILLNILLNNSGVQSLRSEASALNVGSIRLKVNENFMSVPIENNDELNTSQEELPPTTINNKNLYNRQENNNPTIETAKFVDGNGNKYEAAVINSCPYRCSCLGNYLQCGKLLETVPELPDWVNRLDLAGNKLNDDIENTIGNLTKLVILNLKKNRLQKIPMLRGVVALQKLNLSNNKIKSITMESLQLLTNLKYIDLSRNIIRSIELNSFPPNNQITNINLNSNRLKTLKEGCFGELKELLELQLNDNNLFTLGNGIFKDLINLKKLYLNGNHINISYLTFQGLVELRTLRLCSNKLRQLSDGVFHPLKLIENIELDSNRITHLSRQGFYNLTSLHSLSLSNNTIDRIDSDTWEFTQYLQSLDLSNNFLIEFKSQHLGKLKILNLSTNQIQHIADGTFENVKNLEQIDLSYNKLSWIIEDSSSTPFKSLKKLKKLDLSANNIKTISQNSFVGLGLLQHLNLSKNNLTTIQFNAFENLQHLKYLDLLSDHFLCDCNLKWLLAWLKNIRSVSGIDYDNRDANINVVCDYPQNLRGKNLLSLQDTDFMCNESPKPRLIKEPSNQLAIKGTNVTLECSAISSAATDIRILWRRDNIDILQNETEIDIRKPPNSNSTLISSFLFLWNVSRDHTGKYQCVVVNAFGTTYSSKFKITVASYPGFNKVPTNITIDSGSTARLDCSAFGEPMPEIAWQKDGGNDFPAARERRMRIMSDNAFFIMNAKPVDMGIYTCTAETPAGIITANATLIVNEYPSFVRRMQNKEVIIGETVVLECMAAGSPKPTIKWYKDEKPLLITERHFFAADKQLLIIVSTTSVDTGNYKCELQNNIAAIVDFAMLTIVKGELSRNVVNVEEMTGIVIITVFCCAIGTSIIWVVIIYQTKKSNVDSNPINETAMTTMWNINHTIATNNNETSFNSVNNERERLNSSCSDSLGSHNSCNGTNQVDSINVEHMEEKSGSRIDRRVDSDDDDTAPLYHSLNQINQNNPSEERIALNRLLPSQASSTNLCNEKNEFAHQSEHYENNSGGEEFLKQKNHEYISSKDSGTGSDTIKESISDLTELLPPSSNLNSINKYNTKAQQRQNKNDFYLQPRYQLNHEQHLNSKSSTTPDSAFSVNDYTADALLPCSDDSCCCVIDDNPSDYCKIHNNNAIGNTVIPLLTKNNNHNKQPISINCSNNVYNNSIKDDKIPNNFNNSISLPVTPQSNIHNISTILQSHQDPNHYHFSNYSIDDNSKIMPIVTSLPKHPKTKQNSLLSIRNSNNISNDNHKIPPQLFTSFHPNRTCLK